VRRGWDVCAAVVSDLTFDARVWKEARSLANAGYRVRLIGCRYELPASLRRGEGLIEVVEIPLGTRRGQISVVGRAVTLLRLWVAVIRTPARAYHAHNIHVGPAAWLASRLRRARLVYDAHELYDEASGGLPLPQVTAPITRVVERFMVRRSDAVFTTNLSRVDHLRERYGRTSIEVLANVPRRVDEVVPLDPGYPSGAPIILYQGGIYARTRAFRETIEALSKLVDAQFVIIGFGRDHDLDLIRQWAREYGVSTRVHLLPPRPFDELVRTAAGASVGLVPIKATKTNHRLGDTNKLFEYLMAGLPVAASDLPEIRRVATQGDPPVGELFDPNSPTSIADAIRRVIADTAYERRRREARRLALEKFNWEIEERRLISVYRTLFTERGATGTMKREASSPGP
jgi:glycosyltransferase involved in cell wall biosynthesis